MARSVDLSIIIVNHNTGDILDKCLGSVKASLRDSPLKYETIVVDNASSDNSREILGKKYPQAKLILNKTNIGFGPANNQGVKAATGEMILFLNSDIIVIENAIDKLYKFTKRHRNAFVGGKLFNIDGTSQPSCGPNLSLPVVFAALFLQGDKLRITRYSPNNPKYVDWVSGACIMTAKKVIEDDLYFDESIFLYMEEIDLFMRARKKSYKVIFYPSSGFIHLGSASSKGKTQPVLNIYKGLLYLYKKHYYKSTYLFLVLLLRLKAYISLGLGYLTGNSYLKQTYGQALKLV